MYLVHTYVINLEKQTNKQNKGLEMQHNIPKNLEGQLVVIGLCA